jgi:hypothetical protein
MRIPWSLLAPRRPRLWPPADDSPDGSPAVQVDGISVRSLDFASLGDHFGVRFDVRPLESAKLLWLNHRWLIESGIDPLDQATRVEFASQLLRRFAVTSLPGASAGSDRRTAGAVEALIADRYGSSNGSSFGGSGRCGSAGELFAKGIGPTPLVSSDADAAHRTGLLALADAFKEAISAEIVSRELPWGAIPVVAVIDAGLEFIDPLTGARRRAGILIRPTFLRPAHFERSILFGDAGHRDSDQFKDAQRVQALVRHFAQHPELGVTPGAMFRRFAQQVGVARALRLWHGRFLSSNLSVDGALVDFGAFRAMPSWRLSFGHAGECFGAEMVQLRHAFLSIASYFAKYAPEEMQDFDPRLLAQSFEQSERSSFRHACLDGMGLDEAEDGALAREALDLILRYAELQGRTKVGMNVPDPRSWIDAAFDADGARSFHAPEQEARIAFRFAELVTQAERRRASAGFGLVKVRQFFGRRRGLAYEAIERKTRNLERLAGSRATGAPLLVQAFIDRQLQKCMPWSRSIPRRLNRLASSSNVYSAVHLCEEHLSRKRVFRLQAARLGDELFLLGCRFPLADLSGDIDQSSPGVVRFELPLGAGDGGRLRVGRVSLQLPAEWRLCEGDHHGRRRHHSSH